MKEELVKRYELLYERINYILGNYLVETNKGLELKVDDIFILALDEFLFGNNKIEDTVLSNLHKMIYTTGKLIEVSKKMVKLEEENKEQYSFFQKKIDISAALKIIEEFLYNQENTKLNKSKKKVLDEYYRLLGYQNDGIIRYSGAMISSKDIYLYSSIPNLKYEPKNREIGVENNDFLIQINNLPRYDNDSIFTEDEKQEIYLRHHKELPWNFKLECQNEDSLIIKIDSLNLDVKIKLESCHNLVPIKEEDIVYYNNEFYQVCPNCGSLIKIDKKYINEPIQDRIINRNFNDELMNLKMVSSILHNKFQEEKRLKLEKQ